jgi:hypothetical protein
MEKKAKGGRIVIEPNSLYLPPNLNNKLVRKFLFILTVVLPFNIFAQNLVDGYVVFNSKDTLKGKIDLSSVAGNMNSISFYPITQQEQKLSATDILAFGFKNRAFQTHNASAPLPRLTFLEVYEQGKLTLLGYPNSSRDDLYYILKDNKLTRLESESKIVTTSAGQRLLEGSQFISQLDILTLDCSSANEEVSKLKFNLRSLSEFVRNYNTQCFPNTPSKSFNLEDSKQKPTIRIEPFLGANLVKLAVDGNSRITSPQNKTTLSIGSNFHVRFSPKTPLRLTLGLGYNNKGAIDESGEHEFDLDYLNVNLGLTYFITEGGTISPFLNFGGLYGKLLNKDSAYVTINNDGSTRNYFGTLVDPVYSELGFYIGGGLMFDTPLTTFKLNVNYESSEIPFNLSNQSYNNRVIKLTLGVVL